MQKNPLYKKVATCKNEKLENEIQQTHLPGVMFLIQGRVKYFDKNQYLQLSNCLSASKRLRCFRKKLGWWDGKTIRTNLCSSLNILDYNLPVKITQVHISILTNHFIVRTEECIIFNKSSRASRKMVQKEKTYFTYIYLGMIYETYKVLRIDSLEINVRQH